jgi:hypothetical protein
MDYAIGNKYSVTSPRYDLTSVLMRITEVMWDIDSTTIVMSEEAAL